MKHYLVESHFSLPLIFGISYVVCALLFAKGFLLNRVEIYEHQTCYTVEPSVIEQIILPLGPQLNYSLQLGASAEDYTPNSEAESSNEKQTTCRTFSNFQKAIFIVVDALRYDFAVFNHSKNETGTAEPYENKLTVIDHIMRESPHNSLLLKFIADPPTTTMQRLKGLTTGSLPTFVDAGKNFASSEIGEDNFIYQMNNMGKRIVFMGDDTWESLYKKYFSKSYPFPSFNVRDLHTVDNGCIANLFPEMEQENWDIIIAHFLGVDHCGHRYGPNHPAMAEKLQQINTVIQSVIERMPTDSVLFVLGDHGMTKTGDHGGDSAEEVGAALFVYSPSKLRGNTMIQQQEHVAQIDLVPSVSLLIGLPIPFSNLGRLIPDLFTIPSGNFKFKVNLPQNVRASLSYVCALDRNARQVKNYINLYHNLTGAFPSSSLSESKIMVRKVDRMLKKIASNLNSETDINMETLEEDLVLAEELLTSYLDFIREMCHNIWAQFDDFSINVGVCILLGLLSINLLPLLPISVHYFHLCFLQLMFLVSQWKSVKTFTVELAAIAFVSPILQKISTKARKLNDQTRTWKTSKLDIVIGSLCCAHSLSLTSNSFVMYESYTISHVVNSVICFVFIGVCVTVQPPVHTKKRSSLGKFLKVTTLVFLFLLASRLGHLFWSCREEQPWCDASPFLIPLSNLRSSASRIASLRYVSSGASLYAPVFLMKRWFKQKGNLGVSFLRSFPINYGLPLAAICIFLYWALLAVPSPLLDKLPPWQHIFLPQMAYLMLFVSLVSLTVHPVCANLLPKEKGRKFGEISRNIDHEKQEEVKSHSRSRAAALKKSSPIIPKEIKKEVPVVCGLGTVYSANLIQFLVTLYLLICLLLGDGLVLSMVLMAAQISVVLTVRTLSGEEDHPTVPFVPVWLIAVWSLMSMQYFFTTGHQATIPSIRFETAFIGYHGDYPSYLYWIPAVLILLNTFAGQVMFAAALPLALLWPLTQKNRGRTSDDGSKGEMQLQQDPNLLKRRLSHLIMHYISFQALQLFGTMLSAAIHRRHLMAWSIFAPRFIFQGVAFLMTLPTLLISCGLLMLTYDSLNKWIDKHLK